MFFQITIVSRLSTSRAAFARQSRLLSSQGCIAIEKLRNALEDYRKRDYTQTIPTRFKKEVAKAAANKGCDNIVVEGMQRVLLNIGFADRVSYEEMKTIFMELGDDHGEIPVQKMIQIM